ncbi:MAG: patatin-like phospholipase family protein [Chlamydiota bacterium]
MKVNLVFEGGGIRGIASAVAAHVLDLNGYEAVAFGGASVGAYLAALRAQGYSAEETIRLFASLKCWRFIDPWPWAWVQFCACCGGYIRSTLDRFCSGATFAELRYPLKVTAFNVTRLQTEVFSALTWPGMRVSLAVRASSALVPFFTPVFFNGDEYWDGGMIDNFPIDCFDGNGTSQRTIGILLKGHEYDPPSWIARKLKAPVLSTAVVHESEKRHRASEVWRNVCEVDTGKIGATHFLLSDEDKRFLVRQGIAGAVEFMEKKECIEPSEMIVPDERELFDLMGIN